MTPAPRRGSGRFFTIRWGGMCCECVYRGWIVYTGCLFVGFCALSLLWACRGVECAHLAGEFILRVSEGSCLAEMRLSTLLSRFD